MILNRPTTMKENDSNKHIPSEKTNLKQRIEDFSGYTTFHGVHFVIGPDRGILRRIFWLLLVLTGLGFLSKQLVESYKKLQAKEHVITRDIIPTKKLVFPAITLCNQNMMRKSRIKGTDAVVYLDQLNIFKKVFSPNELANKTLSSSFDIEKAVEEFGHTAKDMLKVCTWDGKLCNSLNVTTRFSQMYGLCHTFNPGKEHHPLLFSTSVKRNRGLNLMLDINADDYFGITSYFSTGIRMAIHDQDEESMVEANGIDASPGHMITINIERTEYISLPRPYTSACGSRPLETSKSYTQSKCLMECKTRKVIRQCGCKLLGMPDLQGFNGTRYCNPNEITSCLFDNLTIEEGGGQRIETVLAKFFITYDSSFSSDNPKEECDCPKSCKKIQYKIAQLNTVTTMSESFWNDYYSAYSASGDSHGYIKAYIDREKKKVRENWLAIIIYYDDLHTVRTTEKVAYDITDFGSDVGGYLGLFLGCSVLTVIEIFDFIVCYYFGKKRARFEVEQARETNEKM